MKSFSLYLLLLLLFFTIGCEDGLFKKDKADVPCLDSFSCYINGEPFETIGNFNCTSKKFSLQPDSHTLKIVGHNCNIVKNDFGTVVFDVLAVGGPGVYSIREVNCGYLDSEGRPVAYNVEVSGEVRVTGFVEDNYSEDWTGGYVEGTFWFTAYNENTLDTVRVTRGQFCGRL